MKIFCIDRKIVLFFCFWTFTSLCAVGQENQNSFSQEEYQAKLISDKHVNVKGTSLFIVPPDSFIEARSFAGFIDKLTSAKIIIRRGGSFENTLALYISPEVLDKKAKNAHWKSEKIKIKDRNMVFMNTENQDSGTGKVCWILICENGEESYILEGSYPTALQNEYSQKIKDCISSIVIR